MTNVLPVIINLLIQIYQKSEPWQVSGVCKFENNIELVLLDEGRQVLDHVRVVQLLEY